MASPNYDAMSVALSKKIGDPVASASTNGSGVWTSAFRDVLLNQAHREWLRRQIVAGNFNALQSYRNREGKALTNNVLALTSWTGTAAFILSAYNSTDTLIVNRLPDGYMGIARAGSNAYYTPSTTNQFYQIEGGSFVLLDGGTTTGDTIVLEYVKAHSDLSAGGASDTLVPPQYWDQVVDIAFAIAKGEKATQAEQVVGRAVRQDVAQEIPQNAKVGTY